MTMFHDVTDHGASFCLSYKFIRDMMQAVKHNAYNPMHESGVLRIRPAGTPRFESLFAFS